MWTDYNGSKFQWRTLPTGEIEVKGQGVIRSKGAPLTMLYLVREHGQAITQAARLAGIPREWLAAMITVEAQRARSRPLRRTFAQIKARLDRVRAGEGWRAAFGGHRGVLERRNGLRFDTISLRLEPGFLTPVDTPGRVSACLPQVLLSTAQEMADRVDLELSCSVRGEKVTLPHDQTLIFSPVLSLILAAEYMAYQCARYADGVEGHPFDFAHLTGAYNAGRVRPDTSRVGRNPYGVLAFHRWRTDKAVRYLNDCYSEEVKAAWGEVES